MLFFSPYIRFNCWPGKGSTCRQAPQHAHALAFASEAPGDTMCALQTGNPQRLPVHFALKALKAPLTLNLAAGFRMHVPALATGNFS